MKPPIHPWNLTSAQAVRLQKALAGRVVLENRLGRVETVAGVDVGLPRGAGMARAAVVVLRLPDLTTADWAVAERPVEFPYVPGLLSFREGPVILDALNRLARPPDLLIFDGQGIAHPRRLGIASHIGVLADLPAIGCAKSRLCGTYEEPPPEKGGQTPLHHNGEIIGAALRTRTGVKPVFVSPGHRVDHAAAVHWVLAACTKYRLPETTRRAHRVAGGEVPPSPDPW